MRLAVLTSVDTRHRYFANALRAKLPVVAVGYEQVGYAQATITAPDLTAEEQGVVAHHYAERVRQETAFFGHQAEFLEASAGGRACAGFHIAPGELNTPRTLALLEAQGTDAVAVFGTNLIKAPLLGRWPGRIINMHLGLSPYYRGTATNFYPLVNGEPEYVGATIHLIDAGIDSGPILKHARPTITAEDMPHTIGCKAILAGIEAMIGVLQRLDRDRHVTGTPQWTAVDAKLYLRKHYHPRQVVELYRNIDSGMIREYAADRRMSSAIRLID